MFSPFNLTYISDYLANEEKFYRVILMIKIFAGFQFIAIFMHNFKKNAGQT